MRDTCSNPPFSLVSNALIWPSGPLPRTCLGPAIVFLAMSSTALAQSDSATPAATDLGQVEIRSNRNNDSEVRREAGTQLQPYVFTLLEKVQEGFTNIAGTFEQSPPPGVTAAAAIADLQEAGQTCCHKTNRAKAIKAKFSLQHRQQFRH